MQLLGGVGRRGAVKSIVAGTAANGEPLETT